LANTIVSNPKLALDPEMVNSAAINIERCDKQYGIKYGKLIQRPEEFMFRGVFKQAEQALKSSVAVATGSVYSFDQLGKLANEDVDDLWGAKVASEVQVGIKPGVEKVAKLAASLDWREATIFDWKMKELGEKPIREMPVKMGISANQRKELAEVYTASPI
jgi:hypothetical protein